VGDIGIEEKVEAEEDSPKELHEGYILNIKGSVSVLFPPSS
jgi:hypothetical protein